MPGWFGELENFDTKLGVEAMAGKWILEIGEMGAATKSELEQQKAFISRQSDTVRLAYRPDPETFLRQCVFVATTNDDEFLMDSTGNRRWWPVRCSREMTIGQEIDTDRLGKEVDQIWAEAMTWYADMDATLLLGEEAQKEAETLQIRARKEDSLEGIIEAWLDTPARKNRYEPDDSADMFDTTEEPRDRVCLAEIWRDCLGRKDPITVKDSRRLGLIMTRMKSSGWIKPDAKIRLGKYGKPHAWVKKDLYAPF
jgi:predicted P-loop ATPase